MTDNPTDGQNVYVIEHEHGYVKIGVSTNPKQRIDKLQTGCPYELDLLGVIETDSPFEVESNLHEKYDGRQKQGEWYNLSTREKSHLLRLCDMTGWEVDWRYETDAETRREMTLRRQGLIG